MSSKQLIWVLGLSDHKESLPSCSIYNEGSDDGGSDSDAKCFSTISPGPAGFEDVEGMELGFGGSPESLELGLSQIAEGTPDDDCLDVDDVDPANHPKSPKEGLLCTVYLLMDQLYFYCWILKLVVKCRYSLAVSGDCTDEVVCGKRCCRTKLKRWQRWQHLTAMSSLNATYETKDVSIYINYIMRMSILSVPIALAKSGCNS
jgi:hypothetical protein